MELYCSWAQYHPQESESCRGHHKATLTQFNGVVLDAKVDLGGALQLTTTRGKSLRLA